jgi:hypothetical protein
MQDRVDAVLEPRALANDVRAAVHLPAQGVRLVVGQPHARQVIGRQQLRENLGVDLVGLHLCLGDRTRLGRIGDHRAYVALGGTTVLYVAISVGVFGTLTVAEVTHYGATAVAEVARPALGDVGFTAVTIAALLATSSSVNATLYASKGFTGTLAGVGQFPPLFGERSRLGTHGNLIITTALILIFVNLIDLSSIASVGSAVSLSAFVLVGLAGYRLRRETHANTGLLAAAVAASALVLLFLAIDTLRNDPGIFRRHRGHDRSRGGPRHRVKAVQGSPASSQLLIGGRSDLLPLP